MRNILLIACAYASAVLASELTLGSAAFPLHFWYFGNTPAWQWSVPVHLAGFLWITLWNRALINRPAVLPFLASWAFFAGAETANLLALGLFEYSPEPLGRRVSFLAVLVLYGMLCAACVYALRRYVFKAGGR